MTHRRLLRIMRRIARTDTGSGGGIALFAIGMVVCLLIITGLVVDGGTKAAALDRANRIAMEAARAGAQQLTIPGGGAAEQAAQAHLAAEGVTGTATVTSADRVDVHVTITVPARFLKLININTLTATGDGFAYAEFSTGGGP